LDDRHLIDGLLAAARWRHAHLDWLEASDLLGQSPFLMAIDAASPAACLACPPDPPGFAWIRVFACASSLPPPDAWAMLWPVAADAAARAGATSAAALTADGWMAALLRRSGFAETNRVVFLEHQGRPTAPAPPAAVRLRAYQVSDLPDLLALDQQAFVGLWAYSQPVLCAALDQAALVTVVEADGRLVGYQLSTASALGAHLARLAVHPTAQGRGYGRILVQHLLHEFGLRGFDRVSVNTQADNAASLHLYRRLEFRDTGQVYPVYTVPLPEPDLQTSVTLGTG
jgi:ribosomal-protein-alanine N-acetyltransferase